MIWRALPVWLAAPLIVPLALVAIQLLTPTKAVWAHLWGAKLPEMIVTTLLLVGGVGLGTLLLGTALAWLISAYTFPGRKLFAWLLVLPLAMPSYVLGFIYMATFDYAGPVQTLLRGWFGADAWFPEVRSLGMAVLVLTLVLYPYVYLLARAALREQAASTVEAARALGLSRFQTLLRLVLPLARPSLVAGTTLAMLEALTDFATVRFFNVSTLSEGVFRIWEGMMDRDTASELASLLLLFALTLMLVERALRGQARYTQQSSAMRRAPAIPLGGAQAWLATSACGLVLAAAFLLPLTQLVVWTISELRAPTLSSADGVAVPYITTTALLALVAAVLACVTALLLASSTRLEPSRAGRGAARLAALGYAMPGAVVAVGVLLALSSVDQLLNRWGLLDNLLLTGSIIGLLYAYVVRFLAVAFTSVEASIDKVTPQLVEAARCMGAGRGRVLWRIHTPLVRAGALAGATLVFVDVVKELPITMLLRPFGMDTLAIWTYMLAAESFWQSAALPALLILLVGVVPVALLARASERGSAL